MSTLRHQPTQYRCVRGERNRTHAVTADHDDVLNAGDCGERTQGCGTARDTERETERSPEYRGCEDASHTEVQAYWRGRISQ